MTTESSTQTSPPRPQAPSIHVVRARRLLLGGLAGGVVAAIVATVVLTLIYGRPGLNGSALAAGMVLFFYVIGQVVMVMFADAGARTLMAVSMASYTFRVAILGLILLAFNQNRDRWPALEPMSVFLGTVIVVVGWLLAEVLVFARLRISTYDEGYTEPKPTQSGSGEVR